MYSVSIVFEPSIVQARNNGIVGSDGDRQTEILFAGLWAIYRINTVFRKHTYSTDWMVKDPSIRQAVNNHIVSLNKNH